MINIPMNTRGAVDRSTLMSINHTTVQGCLSARNITSANAGPSQPPRSNPAPVPAARPIPQLRNPVQKGQKAAIESGTPLQGIHACFGWNTLNPQCDIDVSAFLLDSGGKVPGDSWFVFYGQTASPDQSVTFHMQDSADREMISVDFQRLNADIKRIVFVLTINDAFEKQLNFSMVKDAYIRIMSPKDNSELISFKMTDYYSNVISMMIGEVYLHNGAWKFNAIGNGVARDLAGLCALYGVQVND